MTPDRTRWCELLVGLERVEVLDVVRRLDRLVVTVESTERLMGCSACGTKAKVKDRDRVELADLLQGEVARPHGAASVGFVGGHLSGSDRGHPSRRSRR